MNKKTEKKLGNAAIILAAISVLILGYLNDYLIILWLLLGFFISSLISGFLETWPKLKLVIAHQKLTTQDVALSLTYLGHLKRSYWSLKLILSLCVGFFFGLSWIFPQMNLSFLPVILFSFIILLIFKEQLLEYRIRNGLFGTNRTEAKALIEFIIKNSEDIDFTDSNGNLRRALLPEAETDIAEQPVPSFGEEAPA